MKKKTPDHGLLSAPNQAWIASFAVRHGRKPRVLHIGNIANNAYNNAKILNQAGLENYVICYDYYHMMGCPEWEDADFVKFTGDHFKPEWFRLRLNDFVRPAWFIQGPATLCLRAFDSTIRNSPDSKHIRLACLSLSGNIPPKEVRSEVGPLLKFRLWLLGRRRRLVEMLKKHSKTNRLMRWLRDKMSLPMLWLAGIRHRPNVKLLIDSFRNEFKTSGIPHPKQVAASFQLEFGATSGRGPGNGEGRSSLTIQDMASYFDVLSNWDKNVFQHCDFVMGYSTDPVLPMLCAREYFAFEHGTIREIPYHDTPIGRLTALAYRRARHVFVTNFDCRASADFLAPGRYTMINHPFDEDHAEQVTGWGQLRRTLQQELDSEFVLFHPTRQDWVEGSGYADKANDVFLKAFCELRNRGLKIGLVCCEWGSNVSDSKQLVENAKCARYVKWVQPLPVVAFERTCLACDIVADQFKLGSFGGVLFKAMAVGRPILTFLDEKQVLQQYAKLPPVINCRTQQEISAALSRIFSQSNELELLGKISRDWIKQHHGKAATVNAQVDQFRLFDLSRKERGASRFQSLSR